MTALNYVLKEDMVTISMDTLARSAIDYEPYKYVSKIYSLPHINCVLCGTGDMEAIVDWFCLIQKNLIIARDIHDLNLFTLLNIAPFMKERIGDHSTTIYQFGLHELDGKFHGYVYRSSDNFFSEKLPYCSGFKPVGAFNIPDNYLLLENIWYEASDERLAKIMHKQKEYEDSRPLKERVGIGGVIQILTMNKDGYTLVNYQKFDDYNKIYEQILDNSEKNTERQLNRNNYTKATPQ